MPARTSLIGQTFGRLKVIADAESHRTPNGRAVARVICECSCGMLKTIRIDSLSNGRTLSCGCFRKENTRTVHTKHGRAHGRLYWVWAAMLDRCRNHNNKQFKDYGGRGITVCERWLSFSNFLQDMGECPQGLTLDRRNNNGNYEPGNCRWATRLEQAHNKER